MLSGIDYFSANPPYDHHELTLSNINGLVLILTVLSAIVELIVARTEHPERTAPPPSRPDLRSHP